MNTPSSSAILRVLFATGAGFILSSCYSSSGGYGSYGGGYGGGYGGYRPIYSSYGRSRCSSCGHSPCRCGSRHYGSHDDHRGSHGSSHSKSSSHDYKIAGGSVGSKTKPTGAHSLDWYKSRGYDTSKLAFRDQHGHTKTGSNYSKGSSSPSRSYSSSSSSSSRNKSSSNRNNNNNNRSASNRSNNSRSNSNKGGGGGSNKGGGGGGNKGGGKGGGGGNKKK